MKSVFLVTSIVTLMMLVAIAVSYCVSYRGSDLVFGPEAFNEWERHANILHPPQAEQLLIPHWRRYESGRNSDDTHVSNLSHASMVLSTKYLDELQYDKAALWSERSIDTDEPVSLRLKERFLRIRTAMLWSLAGSPDGVSRMLRTVDPSVPPGVREVLRLFAEREVSAAADAYRGIGSELEAMRSTRGYVEYVGALVYDAQGRHANAVTEAVLAIDHVPAWDNGAKMFMSLQLFEWNERYGVLQADAMSRVLSEIMSLFIIRREPDVSEQEALRRLKNARAKAMGGDPSGAEDAATNGMAPSTTGEDDHDASE